VHLNYFAPRASEVASWTIDETINSMSALPERVLEDARVLVMGDSEETDVPAWHLPAPIPGNKL
jgi:hypothetical protein